MSNNKCLMDIICNVGKTFMDSHVTKVFHRCLGWLWEYVSHPGSTVGDIALSYRVHCWSPPLQLSCQGWREEEKHISREAWSSLAVTLLFIPWMKTTPVPHDRLSWPFNTPRGSASTQYIICDLFSITEKKIWCWTFNSMGNYYHKLHFEN